VNIVSFSQLRLPPPPPPPQQPETEEKEKKTEKKNNINQIIKLGKTIPVLCGVLFGWMCISGAGIAGEEDNQFYFFLARIMYTLGRKQQTLMWTYGIMWWKIGITIIRWTVRLFRTLTESETCDTKTKTFTIPQSHKILLSSRNICIFGIALD
jgi:hypothetical protein